MLDILGSTWASWLALDVVLGLAIGVLLKVLLPKIPLFQYKHVDDLKGSIEIYSEGYKKHATDDDPRRRHYAKITETYYNLCTDFYEWGWGQSFHFAPRYDGESFDGSMARYEHYVAAQLGLPTPWKALPDNPPLRVADVGCGIGGPMRTIARFFKYKVRITGVNITKEHIRRAQRYNERQRIENCDFLHADFNNIPVPDNTFDAIYEFEATVHSTDLETTFKELYRVLKPGGRLVTAQYCLVNDYDPSNERHLDIIRRLDNYNGFYSAGRTVQFASQAFKNAGFKILSSEDVFSKEAKSDSSFQDVFTKARLAGSTPILYLGKVFFYIGETLRILPRGSFQVQSMLVGAAQAYKEAGYTNIFTPGQLFVLEKPKV